MPNRILKESICISDNLNELSAEAERLFYRILVNCDDYGRMEAHPKIIRAKCFPRQIDTITDADAIIWLQALATARLITFYEVSGQRYLFCTTWEKHQQIRAKRSKYPNPPSSDINCNQPQANVPVIQSNPIQSESNPNPIRQHMIASEIVPQTKDTHTFKSLPGTALKAFESTGGMTGRGDRDAPLLSELDREFSPEELQAAADKLRGCPPRKKTVPYFDGIVRGNGHFEGDNNGRKTYAPKEHAPAAQRVNPIWEPTEL